MHARGIRRWMGVGALSAAGLLGGCGTRATSDNREGWSEAERQQATLLREQRAQQVLNPTYNGTIRDIPESAQGRLQLPAGSSIDTDEYTRAMGADVRPGGAAGQDPHQPGTKQGAGGADTPTHQVQTTPGSGGSGEYTPKAPEQMGSSVQSAPGSTGQTPPAADTTSGQGVSGPAPSQQKEGAGGAGTEGPMDDHKTPGSQGSQDGTAPGSNTPGGQQQQQQQQ